MTSELVVRPPEGRDGEEVALDAFLRSRGLPWRPTRAGDQHYDREVRRYLREARRAFADSATVAAALRRYADEVGESPGDE